MATNCTAQLSEQLGISAEEAQSLIDEASVLVREYGEAVVNDSQAIQKGLFVKRQDAAKMEALEDFSQDFVRRAEGLQTGQKADFEDAIYSQILGTNTKGDVVGSGISAASAHQSNFIARMQAISSDLKGLGEGVEQMLGANLGLKQTAEALISGIGENKTFTRNVFLSMAGREVDDDLAIQTAQILNKHRKAAYADSINKGTIATYTNELPIEMQQTKVVKTSVSEWVESPEVLSLTDDTLRSVAKMDVKIDYDGGELTDAIRKKARLRLRGHLLRGEDIPLKFTTPESGLAFKEKFGGGSIIGDIQGEMDTLSRNAALTERFGSNPRANLEKFLEAKRADVAQSRRFSEPQRRKLLDKLTFAKGTKVRLAFDEVAGVHNKVVDPSMDRIAKNIRTFEGFGKLGGATLSAFADIPTIALAHTQQGLGYMHGTMKALDSAIRGSLKNGTLNREIVDQMGVLADNINIAGLDRFSSGDVASGRIGYGTDLFYRASGLTEFTRRNKAGYAKALSNEFGKASEKAFDSLHEGQKAILKNYGFTGDKWDVLKQATKTASDGNPYLTSQAVGKIPLSSFESLVFKADGTINLQNIQTKSQKLAKAIADKDKKLLLKESRDLMEQNYRELVIRDTGNAVIEPDAATNVALIRGAEKGTLTGEAWRLVAQFKSFPVAFGQRVLGINKTGYGNLTVRGRTPTQQAIGISTAAASYLAWGYISLTAKDLAKGRSMREFNQETVLAVIGQSGALSLIGDAFLSSSSAHGLITGFAGAGIGDTAKATHMLYELGTGNIKGARKQMKSLVSGMTPNLWWSQYATNALIGNHIKEAISPNSLRNTQRFMQQKYGQDYILPPTWK